MATLDKLMSFMPSWIIWVALVASIIYFAITLYYAFIKDRYL